MKTIYEQINNATNTVELSNVVESYLDSINQNNKSESYEELAERLREQNMNSEADLMDFAADKWDKLEYGVEEEDND